MNASGVLFSVGPAGSVGPVGSVGSVATLADLRGASPVRALEAARQLERHADHLVGWAAEILSSVPESWSGPARSAAAQRHAELAERARELGAGLRLCADAVRAAGVHAGNACDALARAEASARAAGLVVLAGGVVVPGRPEQTSDPSVQAVCVAHTKRVAGALESYTQTIGALHARLTTLAAPYAGLPSAAAPPSPPETAEPGAAARWFAGLSDDERLDVIEHHPAAVGPVDGLPGWARDRANRRLLVSLATTLSRRLEALLPLARAAARHRPVWAISDPSAELDAVVDQLDGLRALRQLLDVEDGRVRQLLSVGVSGVALTASVTSGDLDGAGHVAVFVPGFQADVAGDMARYAASIEATADLATRLSGEHGDGSPVVGVTWLGYAAPQLGEVLVPGRTVLGDGPARVGAPALGRLLNGLAVGRPDGSGAPRLVLWGHSYGSIVAGLALRDGGAPVAAAAVFGSPGLGVHSIADLHLSVGQLYVAEAPNDPIAVSGRFGTDPWLLTGMTGLSVAATTLPDGSAGAASWGHERYLDPGSTSQWNLAAIAAGTAGQLLTTPVCRRDSFLAPPPARCWPAWRVP